MKSSFFTGGIKYSSTQRIGIIMLFSIILILQSVIVFADFAPKEFQDTEALEWIALQVQIDSARKKEKAKKPHIYPFNPNFITDYKGYRLGMTVEEIDRLHAFRSENRYVNSAAEFQSVTGVSDSLLGVLSPYFKFPDWVLKRNKAAPKAFTTYKSAKAKPIIVRDVNTATKEELMEVHGIGPAFSDRILKEREKLGAFLSMDQMSHVWGIPAEAIENLKLHFKIGDTGKRKTININSASIKELAQFPFFRYALAKEIVTYRSMNNGIKNAEDLVKINGFPSEKAEIIALYLEF